MPIETPVIRPTNTDPKLFVNREEDLAEIKSLLRQFINDPEAQSGGVLVKGDSGVGKSILSRKAVSDLKQEYNQLVVLEVDGGRLTGVRGLLNKLCDVARNVIEPLEHPELSKQASVLAQIVNYGKITVAEARQFSSEKSAGGKVGGGIWALLTGEVSVGLKRTDGTTTTEGYDIPITDEYLSRLLCALLQDVRDVGYRVLIFLDNLDRIGKMDSQEDANTIAAFVKELLDFPCCILLLNLRTQFTHHTVDRRELSHYALFGLSPKALTDILKKRLEAVTLSDLDREKLAQVAQHLCQDTDNPLAFLRWLDFWLVRTDNDPNRLHEHLQKFVRQNFTSVSLQWIEQAADVLYSASRNGENDSPLSELSERQRSQLERAGAIVPDSLLLAPEERRYRLHHDLDFLFHEIGEPKV